MRGILTVLSPGGKWRARERPAADGHTVYPSDRRWVRQGVFTQLFAQSELPRQGSRRFLDATHVKGPRCACPPSGGAAWPALGRPKGGLNSQISALVDEAGQAIRLGLSAGNDADLAHAQTLAEAIPGTRLVADKGCASDPFRAGRLARGMTPGIPPRSHRLKPCRYRRVSYRKRPGVENFFARLKNLRRVSTR